MAVCFAALALADDLITVNGKEYKNATISRVEPDGIVVRFSGGIVKIPFTDLSKEVQERFHYDPQKAAAAYAEQMAAAQQTNQPAEKSGSQLKEAGHQNAHILACRGTDRLAVGSSTTFQMEEGVNYQVVGTSMHGSFLIRTPAGDLEYNGNRFRVLDGGQYAAGEVTLMDVTSGVNEHWQENKMGYRSKYSSYTADWSGQVLTTGNQWLTHCYAALQWYSNGQPVGTAAMVIGRLIPGQPVSVSLSVPISDGQREGMPSLHIWSATAELKTTQLQKLEW
ncbi:MAG: hypothetical protein ACRD3W_17240 [Terriglobales bacterium]